MKEPLDVVDTFTGLRPQGLQSLLPLQKGRK